MRANGTAARMHVPVCYHQVADLAGRRAPAAAEIIAAVEVAINCQFWRNCAVQMECGALAADLARRLGEDGGKR